MPETSATDANQLPILQGEWDNTVNLRERMKGNPAYEEPEGDEKTGTYAGRQIITRDSIINGGVYLGSGKREAIVVDDQKYPEELNQVYSDLRERMKTPGVNIFDLVFEVSKEHLGGNQAGIEAKVDQIVSQFVDQNETDPKVKLNHFIKQKAGICRHRALLAGYLLERLAKERIIKGQVSIDRNNIPGLGGHAWLRWTKADRGILIIDPSLNYLGPIKNTSKWDYKRPGE